MGTYKATVDGLSLVNHGLEADVKEFKNRNWPEMKIQFHSGIHRRTLVAARATLTQQIGCPSGFQM